MAILVIDHESKTRDTLRYLLRQLGHKIILEAKSAEEALKLIEISKTKIRMLIVDQDLPTMDGLTFTSLIQKKASLEFLPIILMTSDANLSFSRFKSETIKRIDHALMKPFRMKTLETAMTAAFQKRCRSRNKAIFLGTSLSTRLSEANQKIKKSLWSEIYQLNPSQLDQLPGLLQDPRVGTLWVDPHDLSAAELTALNRILTPFKKTTLGVLTPIICLGSDPDKVRPIRKVSQFFINPQSSSRQWEALILQIQTRVTTAWQMSLLFQKSKLSLQKKEPKCALQTIRRMLKLDPHHPEAQIMTGITLEALKRPHTAIIHYQSAILSNPCLPAPYIRLLSLKSNINTQDLHALIRSAIQYCPRNPYLLRAAHLLRIPSC